MVQQSKVGLNFYEYNFFRLQDLSSRLVGNEDLLKMEDRDRLYSKKWDRCLAKVATYGSTYAVAYALYRLAPVVPVVPFSRHTLSLKHAQRDMPVSIPSSADSARLRLPEG